MTDTNTGYNIIMEYPQQAVAFRESLPSQRTTDQQTTDVDLNNNHLEYSPGLRSAEEIREKYLVMDCITGALLISGNCYLFFFFFPIQ